jgi:hypothetical protein
MSLSIIIILGEIVVKLEDNFYYYLDLERGCSCGMVGGRRS